MSENHLDPARNIIGKFGGPERVAAITGKSVSRVYRWMYARAAGGTDGFIPHKEALIMLAHARVNSISVTAADFLPTSQPEDAV